MDLDSDIILTQFGGTKANDLNEKLHLYDENDNEIETISQSPYMSISEIPSYLSNSKTSFSVMSLNCQSINAKFGLLECLLNELEHSNYIFSAICLQETWLTSQCPDAEIFCLPGYQTVALGSTVGKHGGLMIYLREEFRYKTITFNVPSKLWECLFLEISGGHLTQPIILGNVYRPPRNNNDNNSIRGFNYEFSSVLNKVTKLTKNTIITGDFNINLLELNEREAYGEFLDLMITNELFPKISLPTRRSKTKASLLDQMFCRFKDMHKCTKSGIIFGTTSDHYAYFSSFEFKSSTKPLNKFVKVNVSNDAAIESFIEDIRLSQIYENMDKDLLSDPNLNYDIMERTILNSKEKYLPSKTVRFNKYKHKLSPWITNGILASIRYRDRLHYQLTKIAAPSDQYNALENNLRDYKRILNRAIREAKREYYHRVLTNFKHDVKKIWSTINDIFRRNKKNKSFPDTIKTGDRVLTEPAEIANYFNRFFTSVGPNLAVTLHNGPENGYKRYLNRIITSSFTFNHTQPEHVSKIIEKFMPKTSSGHDGLSMKLIKRLKYVLSTPLSLLINQSLCTGIFPEKLKVAKIRPIFKKGDESMVDNYRPVSILPALSKVFEKVVFDQLYKYLTENDLLYSGQYGFRKGHSTELACIEFVDNVIHKLDCGKLPISIFLDLSKAFDTLDHTILLEKLKYHGIDGVALAWFRNYLTNRSQFVQINDIESARLAISTGVPQGSILGPLLFILYVNDICTVSEQFYPILYADDTTLISTLCVFQSQGTVNGTSAKINQELDKIQKWLKLNKLSLNINKTKYIIFHSTHYAETNLPDLNLKIDNVAIERVRKFDFLGVTITDTLTWRDHTSKIANKISKSVGVMSRLKFMLHEDTLKLIYNSLVLPHLYFSILAWGFESERLIKLQKRAVRIIHRAKYNAHSEPLLKKSGLLGLSDIFNLQCTKFYYKFKHGLLPAYFHDFFTLNNQIHGYNTRQSTDLHRFPVNKSKTNSCIRHYIPTLFNKLSAELKTKFETHSLAGFAHNYKRYMINKYSAECLIRDCYVCSRS